MDTRRLVVFRAVAEQRSFTQAALILHLSQSAVSQHVAALEAELGGKLLERARRRVNLTPEGAVLLPHVAVILERIAEAERAVAAVRGVVAGDLRVAASRTVGAYVLPGPLAELGRRYPELNLAIEIENTEQVVYSLLGGTADIGYVEGTVEHPGITRRELFEDELVVVAAAGHRFADRQEVELEELAVEPIVTREPGSGTRQVAEACLGSVGLAFDTLRVAAELTDIEAIKRAVEAGMGVAILSRLTIAKELALGTLVARTVVDVPIRRRILVISAAATTVLPAAEELTAWLSASVVWHAEPGRLRPVGR